MKEIKYNKLTAIQKKLLDAADDTKETAYNPYSHFFVGAAILSNKGKIITGSNYENAAYGPTVCAERSAILAANALGIRCFEKVAVIARGQDFDCKEVTAPCGVCRQTIFECSQIAEKDIEIIMSNTKKTKIIIAKISELLPLAYGPKDLGINVKKFK